MPWTSPRTWSAELVTAALFNEQIRDNLNALKDPPTALYNVNEAADYSTTGTTFANVDATDLSLVITTGGGDVMVGFCGTFSASGSNRTVFLNVSVDGIDTALDDGIAAADLTETTTVSFVHLIEGLSAGSHTFRLRWRTRSGATVTLYAGAGTANGDLHPQFWVREVS